MPSRTFKIFVLFFSLGIIITPTFQSLAGTGVYKVSTTSTSTFIGSWNECLCISGTCIEYWDSGEHSLAECSEYPYVQTSQGSTQVSAAEFPIVYSESIDSGTTTKFAYASTLFLGSIIKYALGSYTSGADYSCPVNNTVQRCYSWWEGKWEQKGDITASFVSDNPPPSDPPPDLPPLPPPDDCGNIVCQCIDGVKVLLERIIQLLEKLAGVSDEELPGAPAQYEPQPPWQAPPAEPPLFQSESQELLLGDSGMDELPKFEHKNVLKCSTDALRGKFPFALFEGLSGYSAACPSITFFSATYSFCWLLDAVRILKYPVLVALLISMFFGV